MIPHDASGLVADAFIPAFDAVVAKVENAVIADQALHLCLSEYDPRRITGSAAVQRVRWGTTTPP